ncbi:MAG: BrnT family toxin [Bacillota bacterium]
MERITRFEWDARNVGHIAKHGVRPEEAEEAFFGGPLFRRARKGLKAVFGCTDAGRYLFVVFVVKPGGVVRVVTARDMTAAERRYYRRERRG